MRAAVNGPLAGVFNAASNVNASFTLTRQSDGAQVSWTPNGTKQTASGLNNDCSMDGALISDGYDCSETKDELDLNRNVGTSTNPKDLTYSYDTIANYGLFGLSVTGLLAGDYELTLNTVVSTLVSQSVQQVPEPGALALVGLALLGAGVSTRRKSK